MQACCPPPPGCAENTGIRKAAARKILRRPCVHSALLLYICADCPRLLGFLQIRAGIQPRTNAFSGESVQARLCSFFNDCGPCTAHGKAYMDWRTGQGGNTGHPQGAGSCTTGSLPQKHPRRRHMLAAQLPLNTQPSADGCGGLLSLTAMRFRNQDPRNRGHPGTCDTAWRGVPAVRSPGLPDHLR